MHNKNTAHDKKKQDTKNSNNTKNQNSSDKEYNRNIPTTLFQWNKQYKGIH